MEDKDLLNRNDFDFEKKRAVRWDAVAVAFLAIAKPRGDDEGEFAAFGLVDDTLVPSADERHRTNGVAKRSILTRRIIDAVIFCYFLNACIEESLDRKSVV